MDFSIAADHAALHSIRLDPRRADMDKGSPTDVFIVSERGAYVARVGLGVLVPLLVLATVTFVLRLYYRLKLKRRLELADWTMVIGFAIAITELGLLKPQFLPNPGPIPMSQRAESGKYALFATPLWSLAMALIKSSIALTLIPFQPNRWWKGFLWSLIAVQLAYGVVFSILVFTQCQPLAAWWDKSVVGRCIPFSIIVTSLTVGSGIHIATDFLTSLAPLTFIMRLARPRREKVCIAILMGLGLFVCGASIAKTILNQDYNRPGIDLWALNCATSTWAITEMLTAAIAANMPFLNPLAIRCLGRSGLLPAPSGGDGTHAVGNGRGTVKMIGRMQITDVSSGSSGGPDDSAVGLQSIPSWEREKGTPSLSGNGSSV